ncbi:MAG TPA: TRAP transporter substrate-binding protein DctP [bacterium]|nr:TRAP transporter substrate-binding protein DctP [bacterium]
MDRRSFLKKAGVATAATTFAAVSYPGKTTHAQTKFRWRLAHSFGPTAPVLGTNLPAMANELRTMSKGQLDIKVYGAGELIPAFGVFDAVKEGSIQMMYSASYYWAGKVPATQFTCAVPFGMNTQQFNSWCYHGGGMEVWREFYAKQGLYPFLAGNTGAQMGGWFRKEIKTVDDLKGLKYRIPGLGGKIYAELGTKVILLPGPEVFPALERGVIDAAEWVGPYYDWNQGLYEAARYYYAPGWHECSTANEMTLNMKAWNSLPKEFQQMIDHAAYKLNVNNLAEFDAKNVEYLAKIKATGKNEIKFFPPEVLKAFYKTAERVNQQTADADPDAHKVYESYKKFMAGIRSWHKINEWGYVDALKEVGAV